MSFELYSGYLRKYLPEEGERRVVVPEGVHHINRRAFKDAPNVEEVLLPFTLREIAAEAFEGCSCLRRVVFQEGLQSIGVSAFANCPLLCQAELPRSLRLLEFRAFAGCFSLKKITLPEDLQILGKEVFTGSGIEELTVMSGDMAFQLSHSCLSASLFPQIRFIHTGVISRLAAPLRPAAAAGYAKEGVERGTERGRQWRAYIKRNIRRLTPFAVANPPLLAALCKDKLIPIELIDLYLAEAEKREPEAAAQLLAYSADAFTREEKAAAEARQREQDDIVFERMAARAGQVGISGLNIVLAGRPRFFSKSAAASLIEQYGGTLQKTVCAATDLFVICQGGNTEEAEALGLETINELELLQRMADGEGEDFFKVCDGTLTEYNGVGAFAPVNVSIPADLGIDAIAPRVFSYAHMASVRIPEGVEIIDTECFIHCLMLKSVIFPDTLHILGSSAFRSCVTLEKIYLPDSVIAIDEGAFAECAALSLAVLPVGLKTLEAEVFKCCGSLRIAVLPDRLESIGSGTFQYCSSLEKVVASPGLCYIGDSAFSGCSSLERITLSRGLEEIGSNAFASCASLRRVELPSGCRSIGKNAFSFCPSLVQLIIPSSVKRIGWSNFATSKGRTLTIIAPRNSRGEEYARLLGIRCLNI